MAEIITDPLAFSNGFDGLTNEEQFDSYYAPKNGQRANETNIGRAAKRNKKEINILRDYLAVLFNKPVRNFDLTVAYQFGEIVGVKTSNSNTTAEYYRYYKSVINDNLAVNPQSDANLDQSYWEELDPMGTMLDSYGNDITAMNDVRLGLNAHNSGYFIVGERLGNNIAIDRDEIMARKYNTATAITEFAPLKLQSDGGDILIHENNVTVNGKSNGVVIKDNCFTGIGTLEPLAELHVNGMKIMLSNPSSPLYTLNLEFISGTYSIGTTDVDLNIGTNNTNKHMTLNKIGGRVDVGTYNGLGGKLNVSGKFTVAANTSADIISVMNTNDSTRLRIGAGFIGTDTNGTVSSLHLNPSGGAIDFHGSLSTDKQVKISTEGSLIIASSLTSSTYKLYIEGNEYITGSLDGLDNLKLGRFTSGTYLDIVKGTNYHINSDTTLFVQDTNRLTINATTHFENGKLGLGIVPTSQLHLSGDARIQTHLDVDQNLTVSDEIFVDHTNSIIYLGSTGTNNVGGTIQAKGTFTIKNDVSATDYGIIVESYSNDNRICINGEGIQSKDGAVTKDLSLQELGGTITVHSKDAVKTNAISVTTTGQLVVGKNLVAGDTMSATTSKFEVNGDAFITGDLKGLDDLILGEFTADDKLSFDVEASSQYTIKSLKSDNSITTLNIQPTGTLKLGSSAYVYNGNIGVNNSTPTYDIDVTGNMRATTDLVVGNDFTASDLLFVDHSANIMYLGAVATNGIGGVIQASGNMTIKSTTSSADVPLIVESYGTNDRLYIDGFGITKKVGSAANGALEIQRQGGSVSFLSDTGTNSNAVSINTSGTLIVGKNVANGESALKSDTKFEVHGKSYFSDTVYGLNDLTLGNDTGTLLSIARIGGTTTEYSLNAFTNSTKTVADRLYMQTEGGDVVFNSTTGTSSTVHIDNLGNVGIGKLTPAYKLEVVGDMSVALTLNAKEDIVVNSNLFINGDTISTTVAEDTLYIQRTFSAATGTSNVGTTVFGANADSDAETARISSAGKLTLGSAPASWTDVAERLRVVGPTKFYSADPATVSAPHQLSITPSSTGTIDLGVSAGSKLRINYGTTSNNTYVNTGTINSDGTHVNTGKLIVGRTETLDLDVANNTGNTSGVFKSEISGPTVLTNNYLTTNGDAQLNKNTDTEILRIRRTATEYVRYGGDYIQGVSGTETNNSTLTNSARNSTLRIQPNNGKVYLGNTTTSSSFVTLETKGTIKASTFDGTATQALYADLAERYQSDIEYKTGTVMSHGGTAEITAATRTSAIAGIISDAPAFRMNDSLGFRVELDPINATHNTKSSFYVDTLDIAAVTEYHVNEFAKENLGRVYKLKVFSVDKDANGDVTVEYEDIRTVLSVSGTLITLDSNVRGQYITGYNKGFDWPLIALKGRLPVILDGTAVKGQVIIVSDTTPGHGKAVNFGSAEHTSNMLFVIGVAINKSYTITDPDTEEVTNMVEVKV